MNTNDWIQKHRSLQQRLINIRMLSAILGMKWMWREMNVKKQFASASDIISIMMEIISNYSFELKLVWRYCVPGKHCNDTETAENWKLACTKIRIDLHREKEGIEHSIYIGKPRPVSLVNREIFLPCRAVFALLYLFWFQKNMLNRLTLNNTPEILWWKLHVLNWEGGCIHPGLGKPRETTKELRTFP